MCGNLSKGDIGKEVVLMGWVAVDRNLGSLIFFDLRDITGITQIVVKDEDAEIYELAKTIKSEYVIAVKGKVFERQSKNPKMKTGDIEIIAEELVILDKAQTTPIYIKDDDNASENMRLKYRYLDLRKESLQRNLKTRAEVAKIIRDFLYDEGFIEIETPFLNKPTPEGARDYLVPSRVNPNRFYALPQSPQLMKQLLMISGMDRYYQIVKCFRDEDLRANRQPEFTQVDMELSFSDAEEIMSINERLIQKIFKEIKKTDVQLPLKRITFKEAMEKYGSDKPDTRFGFYIKDLTNDLKNSEFKVFSSCNKNGSSIRGISIGEYAQNYTRKKIDALEETVKSHGGKGLAWIKISNGEITSPIKKFLSEVEMNSILSAFNSEKEDLIFIVADKDSVVFNCLSALRLQIAKENNLIDKNKYEMLWVVDFPLFEKDDDGNLIAKHHPFTRPLLEDEEFLETAPEKVRAMAYDIVINGDEIGGGSIRINNSDLQKRMFNVLNLTEEDINEKFGFFVEALKYGTPPHGGLAYGFDRLLMLLCETDNIKDVIAFPKTQSASSLMTGAPTYVGDEQLKEIHIKNDK